MSRPSHPTRTRLTMQTILVGLIILLAARGSWAVWNQANRIGPLRASDALPIYLSAATVLDGGDPTTQTDLKASYDKRAMRVRANTFSNLYPASTGTLLQPLARTSWEQFVPRWRGILLFGALLAGAMGGVASVSGRARPMAIALGLWIAVVAFPVTAECMALGQVNLLLGGLMGAAMAVAATGRFRWAATLSVLGASLKLVPGLGLWPLVAARRWRALATGAGLGAVILAYTAIHLPLEAIIEGVKNTLEFQAIISPNWINDQNAPEWLIAFGSFRHLPMGLLTVLLIAIAANGVRNEPKKVLSRVLANGIALTSAWLGLDAAAFHVLYAPLYLPALVYCALWPLDEDAPRWAWVAPFVAVLPAILLNTECESLTAVGPEARLVMAGTVVWAALVIRLLWIANPMPRWGWVLVGLSTGWGLANSNLYQDTPHGPPLPDGQEAGVLPVGVGHGGPSPGSDQKDTGTVVRDVLDTMRLERLLPAKASQRLTGHLLQSQQRWAAIDHPEAKIAADIAPDPPAGLVTYRAMALYLTQEHYLVHTLPDAGSAGDEFKRTWKVLVEEEQLETQRRSDQKTGEGSENGH